MRAALVAAALAALAACAPAGSEAGLDIECAIGVAGKMARECSLVRSQDEEGVQFVVYHPDGGFRRFVAASDGAGLVPADGADDAQSSVKADMIEVAVGQDRYRIPASAVVQDDK